MRSYIRSEREHETEQGSCQHVDYLLKYVCLYRHRKSFVRVECYLLAKFILFAGDDF